LRPGSICAWDEMQQQFLKKFFPSHRTNSFKRQIITFTKKPGETFYQCWDSYRDLLNTCPHHGFETWRLVSHFYFFDTPTLGKRHQSFGRVTRQPLGTQISSTTNCRGWRMDSTTHTAPRHSDIINEELSRLMHGLAQTALRDSKIINELLSRVRRGFDSRHSH
jgi:hypothetical protein